MAWPASASAHSCPLPSPRPQLCPKETPEQINRATCAAETGARTNEPRGTCGHAAKMNAAKQSFNNAHLTCPPSLSQQRQPRRLTTAKTAGQSLDLQCKEPLFPCCTPSPTSSPQSYHFVTSLNMFHQGWPAQPSKREVLLHMAKCGCHSLLVMGPSLTSSRSSQYIGLAHTRSTA